MTSCLLVKRRSLHPSQGQSFHQCFGSPPSLFRKPYSITPVTPSTGHWGCATLVQAVRAAVSVETWKVVIQPTKSWSSSFLITMDSDCKCLRVVEICSHWGGQLHAPLVCRCCRFPPTPPGCSHPLLGQISYSQQISMLITLLFKKIALSLPLPPLPYLSFMIRLLRTCLCLLSLFSQQLFSSQPVPVPCHSPTSWNTS